MTPISALTHNPAIILIVDDDRQNRDVLQTMLEPEGFRVLTAATGQEALDVLARQPIDLILLDVMMPEMDGYHVATRIRSTDAIKLIPIIMVTALDNREARMLGMNAGVDRFLTKPVVRADLYDRVRSLLNPEVTAPRGEGVQ